MILKPKPKAEPIGYGGKSIFGRDPHASDSFDEIRGKIAPISQPEHLLAEHASPEPEASAAEITGAAHPAGKVAVGAEGDIAKVPAPASVEGELPVEQVVKGNLL